MGSIGERKKEDVDVPSFDFTTVATATNKFSPATYPVFQYIYTHTLIHPCSY